MALTQRLEFRQTQSLVMTPQLMQAIKLLQLSNLDLAAFVEDELERNPLLERAADTGEPADSREPVAETGSYAAADGDASGDGAEGGSPDGESFERTDGTGPASEDWLSRDLGSRSEMEQTFDTGLDNVFTEEPAEAAARVAQE